MKASTISLIIMFTGSFALGFVTQEESSFIGKASYSTQYAMPLRTLIGSIHFTQKAFDTISLFENQEDRDYFAQIEKYKDRPFDKARAVQIIKKILKKENEAERIMGNLTLWQMNQFITGYWENSRSPLSMFGGLTVESLKIEQAPDNSDGQPTINISADVKLTVAAKKSMEALQSSSVILPKQQLEFEDFKNYQTCFPKYKLDVDTIHTAYYYFHPQSCDFKTLNEKFGKFQSVPLTLNDFLSPDRGVSPEYGCIFDEEEKTLKTLIVVGAFDKKNMGVTRTHSLSKNLQIPADKGERTFHYMNRWFEKLSGYTKLDENLWGHDTPYDRSYRVKDPKTGKILETRIVFSEGSHVPEDKSKDSWLADTDLLIYTGHAGYGGNISKFFNSKEFEDKSKYRLAYLNGCNTFSYSQNEDPQIDYIANRNMSYFENANIDIPKVIKSVMDEKSFADIMEGMAFKPGPVALGGDTPSGLNCTNRRASAHQQHLPLSSQ